MRQNRALIAKFTCAWMYPRLFRPLNNTALGSFHHLPSLPPLLPALPATRAVHFGGIVGRITPTLESDQPLSPCKDNFFSPVCHMDDTAHAVTARLHLSSSREECPTDLSIPEVLSSKLLIIHANAGTNIYSVQGKL